MNVTTSVRITTTIMTWTGFNSKGFVKNTTNVSLKYIGISCNVIGKTEKPKIPLTVENYGGHDKVRTCDPYDVNVVLYHWATRPNNYSISWEIIAIK